MNGLLAAAALEGEVPERGRGRLTDQRVGASQQRHQGNDPVVFQHLRVEKEKKKLQELVEEQQLITTQRTSA